MIPEHCRPAFLIAALGISAVLFFFTSVRRLHDLGLSGWWMPLAMAFCVTVDQLSPGVSFLMMLLVCVRLGFFRGTKGTNFYGPEPVK